jgi:HlyD family secretion protein
MVNKRLGAIFLWFLAGLLLGLGCRQVSAEAEPPVSAPEFQGVVEFEEVQVAFEFPGRLRDLWVRRGDRVQAGDPIAVLDDAREQAATRARRSETDAARSRAAVTQAGSRPEELRALEARIRAADASIRQLSDKLKRETLLLAQGATPPAVVDELSAQLDRSRAERDALAQNLALLSKGPRREEVAAQMSQAEASAALLDAQESRARGFEIYAPLAGDVLDHHREPGEVVGAGTPIVTLADTSRPFAEVFVPQAELARVARGALARVRVDARAEALTAHVEAIGRRVEFTPRYLFSERERPNLVVRVRVRIDDPGRALQAGEPARVQFEPLPAGGGTLGS